MLYKTKYLIWLLLLVFFSPRRAVKENCFAACTTSVNEKRIREFRAGVQLYKFAKLNASFSALRNNTSVLSDYTLINRFRILWKGIGLYLKNKKKLKGYFPFVLEYWMIAVFLGDHHFNEYITPGMYDRYATLFSYLGRENNAKLIGVQDGAAIDVEVPSKIYCDEMYAFDEFEAEIIKRFIRNSDCKYIYTGFRSVLDWSLFDNKKKRLLAIASQDWYTNKTIDLIDRIMSSKVALTWDVVVFPHYREHPSSYAKIKAQFPSLIIEPKKRFSNIDLLITFYSTIVYDFWSVSKMLEVYCLEVPGHIPGYYGRSNVKVYQEQNELISDLEKKI